MTKEREKDRETKSNTEAIKRVELPHPSSVVHSQSNMSALYSRPLWHVRFESVLVTTAGDNSPVVVPPVLILMVKQTPSLCSVQAFIVMQLGHPYFLYTSIVLDVLYLFSGLHSRYSHVTWDMLSTVALAFLNRGTGPTVTCGPSGMFPYKNACHHDKLCLL